MLRTPAGEENEVVNTFFLEASLGGRILQIPLVGSWPWPVSRVRCRLVGG